MNKDVWKKFGVKLFIVLCSVLLVGGVAVAAPRLVARDPGSIKLSEVTAITATPQMYEVSESKLQEAIAGTRSWGDIGVAKLPQYISVTLADGTTQPLERFRDFDVEEDKAISNAGTTNITISPSSNPNSLLDPNGGTKSVDFTLQKNDKISSLSFQMELDIKDYKEASGLPNPSGNYWVTNGLPVNFSASNWKVYYIDGQGREILLIGGTDYTIPGAATALGNYTKQLTLTNYTATPTISAKVLKNMNSSDITAEYDQTSGKIVVKDDGNELDKDTHYYIQNDNTITCDIVGNYNDNYVGSKKFTYPATPSNFNPVFDSYEVNYDDLPLNNRTIENRPTDFGRTVYHEAADGTRTPLSYGTDYIIQNYRVQENGVPVPGATAGSVYMDFVGQGTYSGTATRTYRLVRNLATVDGKKNNDLTIELKPRSATDSFEYDDTYHVKDPELSFTNGILLTAGTDYDVTYTLERETGTTEGPTTDVTKLVDAGTVSLTITGKGYYKGTLTGSLTMSQLQYEIAQKDVTDGTRKLTLLPSNTFELTSASDMKNKIFDSVFIEANPNTTGAREQVKTLEGRSYSFSYDEAGENPIQDSDWGTLQPNKSYYIQVEFYGNYTGTLPAEFKIQEYKANYITINFDECDCGAKNNGDHIYTGEAHRPEIASVIYAAPNTAPTQIPASVYEGKVSYSDNINVGDVTVTVPISEKASGTGTFKIVPRDLTDGTIRLQLQDDFYSDNGMKHEYSGYTNLPAVTALKLDGTSDGGKTLELKPGDYTVGNLYEYDDATQAGKGAAVAAADIQAGKKYCYRINTKGDNLIVPTGSRAYTEPFEFVKRKLTTTGAQGIDFVIKPKDSQGSVQDYLTYINQNLVVTDKKFGEKLRLNKDYKIDISDIDITSIDVNGTIKFKVTGQNGYDDSEAEKKQLELYVGVNITKAMLREKGYTDAPVQKDAPLEGMDEAISGIVTLTDTYTSPEDVTGGVHFITVGETEGRANLSLHYYATSSTKVPETLYAGPSGQPTGQFKVDVTSAAPEPDDPNDETGPRYSKIVLTGKSGYYGTITVKVSIDKGKLENYEIRFRNEVPVKNEVSDDNVYTGEAVTPEFDVVKKSADPDPANWGPDDKLVRNRDYIVPEGSDGWKNNINANENKSGIANGPSLTIRGIYAYEGTLTQTFTIYKRNIGILAETFNPDGTSAGQHWVLNDGFELRGWKDGKSYDYTPSTKTATGETPGVRPQLELYYGDHKLVKNTDYTEEPKNYTNAACYGDPGMTYDRLPKIIFSTKDGNLNSNFKGTFEDTYEIVPIVLTDKEKCKIDLSYEKNKTPFTGLPKEPDVTVTLYRDGDKDNPWYIKYDKNDPSKNDFTLDYNNNNVFVTIGGSSDPDSPISNPQMTHVAVTGKGNLQGTAYLHYLIYGEFEPKGTGGKDNSNVEVTAKKLKYDPNATSGYMKGGCEVTYSEKLAVGGNYDDPDEQLGKRYVLNEAEYTVIAPNRIGKDLDARVESAVEYFEGGKDFKMIIEGDLAADYIKYEVQPIGYSGADTVELDKFLTVTYDTANGKQTLSYDTDYIFESQPTAKLGKNIVNIIPKPGVSDDYWVANSKKTIEYYVTTGLDSLVLENVLPSYPYAHGQPVLKPEDIIVKLGNDRLKYGVDYNIEIIGDATSVGTHTIVVTSANEEKFSGKKEQSFSITQYNLEDAVKDKLITVNYINDEKNPYYTGSTVVPTVTSVTIATSSGALYTLSNGSEDGKPAEYEVVAGTQGDHVNWTSGDVKPDFILSGRGNYKGEISYEYSIKRKDIGDASEVTVAPIDDIYYNNGRDITPVPSIQYRGRDLSGIRHSGNAGDYVDWKDYSQHFTYQYSTKIDLKSTGTKEITIRGIGNFTGETTVSYKVIPLNIKDTELVFTGETPVYDSKPQTPAFQLVYAGDVIMQWTGTRAISDYIRSTPEVVFGNNTNATGDEPATVRISITDENDNYQGAKEATFTILPASLDSHTKFLYRPVGGNANEDLKNYKLNLDFIGVGSTVKPTYAQSGEEELGEGQLGIYYDFSQKANHGAFLLADQDYTIEYKYVEPDTDDVDVREDYQDPDISFAGKVKVTITGTGNYVDTASFWYYIGKDISADATISMDPTTAVYNSQVQAPKVTVSGVEGLKYIIAKYKDEVAVENLIEDQDFVNAGNYFIRIEGDPRNGTYATKPYTLTYTITPRAFSNNLVIDGFKREYSYTGYEIRPVGISVTDYIDKVKYKLTEDVDYTLTYTNNLNAGTAYINVEGKRNFSGKATANFLITSSTISSGGGNGSNSFLDQGTGEISGSTAVSPGNVNMSMDTIDAMYYTGNPVYPKVSIAGMTENVDYTVTFSNNVEVGTAVATINGIGNNTGTIVKNFRIIAQLSKCTISPIPAQQYTGSEVKPSLTVRCGNSILMEGTDYTVTYSNNVNIGTATATIRALNNANYTGSASVRFSIGNDVGGFIISGYAPSYAYTGNAITPGVVVETGSRTLTPGTDYTVSYSNNVNAGTATITVTGTGRYSGTQTANFIIEPKSMQSLTTTDIADRTYTGDAYTPDITVSDGGKVLTKGVDYTVTYTNNTNPGTASILIQGTSSNYSGTKVVSFKISAVAVKGLKASNVKYNSLKLRWTKQGYADGYQICDSKSKAIKTVKTNSTTVTGLTAGKTYTYKVRSYIRNADGTRSYGAFSSVLSATTKLRTPTVKVVSNAKGQARISWSKVSGATGYEIYYKKTASAKYKKLKTVNNANVRVCTVRGMKSGDRAYFRVRAFRKNGSKKVYSSLNPLKVITVK